MQNYCWYLLITAIGLGLFIISLIKTKSRKLFAVYFFISGVTYLFEYFVLVLNNAYAYYPKVLDNGYFDNVLGAVVSNAFIVPMTAIFLTAFELNYWWMVLSSLIISWIDWFFVYLGIYEHFWWKSIYSGLAMPVACILTKQWYCWLAARPNRVIKAITLYFTNLFTHASITFILCAIYETYFYHIGWFENATRDHIAFATAYILCLSPVFVLLIINRINWVWLLSGFGFVFICDYLLWLHHILYLSPGWLIPYNTVVHFGVFMIDYWIYYSLINPVTDN